MQRLLLLILILLFTPLLSSAVTQAHSPPPCCPCGTTCAPKISNCSSSCVCQSNRETGNPTTAGTTMNRITLELIIHRELLIKGLWEAHILPSLMMMTSQITTTAMHQAMVIGSFFDAKHQMETQRTLQTLQAEAHSDYQVSKGVCEFGTLTRSLAATNRDKEVTQIALNEFNMQRQLLNGDGISARGAASDIESRYNKYESTYCNPDDLGRGLNELCQNTNTRRINKDIDFGKIAAQKNFDVDFLTPAPTEDESNLLAIQANLYGHRLMPRIRQSRMVTEDGDIIFDGANLYMKMRALLAKRNVAQSSFSAFAASRAASEANVQPYLEAYLKNMGIREEDILSTYGEKPSYHTQMYLLANKMYQTPNFYVDLYDKPENVDRKKVAIQAVNLKLRHDMYDTKLRSNANQAILLETYLDDYQEKFINEVDGIGNNTQILELPLQ